MSSVLQKMSSIYFFITRHPLIILISLYVLYQLLPYEVEDDYDVLRVLVSALLLKSDDPHQKPQHFPELPEPPPSSVGQRKTRVILLAYARCSLLLSFYPTFISLFRSGSSYVGELLTAAPKSFYFYEPLYALRPKYGVQIFHEESMRSDLKGILITTDIVIIAAGQFMRNLSNPSLGSTLPQNIWTNSCLAR